MSTKQGLKNGGTFGGKRHADSGVPIEVSGNIVAEGEVGEIIINRKSSEKHCEVLSDINQAEGGVSIDCDKTRDAIHDTEFKKEKGGSISGATLSELDKAVSDLHKAETTQKMMKDANAIIRSKKNVAERLVKEAGLTEASAQKIQQPDRYGRVGFPSYSLTNNNANLKRLKERVKMLQGKVKGAESAKTSGEERYPFEGGEIFVNYPANRVQILFPGGRVESDLYKTLRKSGWVYSPTNKAFQRKITPQAIRSAVHMFKATKIEGVVPPVAEKNENEAQYFEGQNKETGQDITLMVGDRVSYTNQKQNKTVFGTIKEVRSDGKYNDIIVDFDNIIPGIFSKKRQAISHGMLVKIISNETVSDPSPIPMAYEAISQHPGVELTTAQKLASEVVNTLMMNDIRPTEITASNKSHTVTLKFADHNMELVIDDKKSPVSPGIFVKRNKNTASFELTKIAPAIEFIKKEWKSKEALENVFNPNTDDEFDEAIMSQIDPQDGWIGNVMKERLVKAQINKQINSDMLLMESDKDAETERIFLKYKELQSKAMVPEQAPSQTININADYKNQYELNKAIEALLTEKAYDYTSEEKNFIRKYSGYGGLDKYGATGKGGLFEYYTPRDVIEKMWALAYKYGYNNGSVLEPSVATGEFLQFAKPETRVVGYEINNFSAQICKILYPTTEVFLQPFEQNFIKNNWTMKDNIDELEKFDLVIGNPPYGDFSVVASRYMTGMGEKDHTKARNYVEYFIRRGLDLLNSGGLLIYIVGAQIKNGGTLFLDSGTSPVKEYLQQNCSLLDAYRLPDSIFERTGVTSEIIVLKKN